MPRLKFVAEDRASVDVGDGVVRSGVQARSVAALPFVELGLVDVGRGTHNVAGDGGVGAVAEGGSKVVLEVSAAVQASQQKAGTMGGRHGPNSGKVDGDVDADGLQLSGVTDAAELEQICSRCVKVALTFDRRAHSRGLPITPALRMTSRLALTVYVCPVALAAKLTPVAVTFPAES